ncbi:ABC transporter ATP-binding protein [Ruegeria sp. PrR005]|uniref:ATP-binding cassette domain-containing protein n=1 Tax=Ruegeria sp. PrR005 TaxID=2706882 RepID=A0A6B2NQ66_9RHOB|nr:oligopeptide/dipeptide ABC transporter ATP-binding protein [Ruegeria sp. PrR005]NDW46281.1 ATP-binding cassette domain-containing protein [Ruegeria sp. PrR005]
MTEELLIETRELTVGFPIGGGLFNKKTLKAVDGISIGIPRGSFFGVVGESGSGKTTLGRALLNAVPITGGHATYDDGEVRYDLSTLSGAELKDYRKRAQLIFQDPYAALSPRMTVRDIIAEPLEVMGLTASREETDARVREIAAKCRLNLEHLRRFPHAFSGGQRQRISIARALVSGPRFVVADESVAALDVSIQADILNLLKTLQSELGLTYMFISHDLSVVAHSCDHVAVMYLGRIVESAPTRKLFAAPRHPYTKALFSAIPSLDPDDRGRAQKLEGEIPSPTNQPPGCKFHTRCPHATELCKTREPVLQVEGDQAVACHRWQELL